MLLQYETDGTWSALHIVDLCAGFIDMMRFADFLLKLGNIAGYQQLIVPTSDASAEIQSNSEDEEESFEDFEGDELDESISVDQMNPRPRFSLLEDYTRMDVTQQYIELAVGAAGFHLAKISGFSFTASFFRDNLCSKHLIRMLMTSTCTLRLKMLLFTSNLRTLFAPEVMFPFLECLVTNDAYLLRIG
ncbi:unnamed protein product, partial [Mesorhabditis belari]|uniref:Uncharacterized protein n=1 Tax=Mesorhabditis belari TaxID=2138241 RepID=A0AAF3FM58_9BILA